MSRASYGVAIVSVLLASGAGGQQIGARCDGDEKDVSDQQSAKPTPGDISFEPPEAEPPLDAIYEPPSPVEMIYEPPPPPQVPAPPASSPPPPPPAPSMARIASPRNQTSWYRRFDYPTHAAFLGEEGTTAVKVTVLPNGRVGTCEIMKSSGFSKLDERACESMERHARFNPALDPNGNPVNGQFSTMITWRSDFGRNYGHDWLSFPYPKQALSDEIEAAVGVRFVVEPDGTLSQCMITRSSGSSVLDQATCENVKKLEPSQAVPSGKKVLGPREVRRTVYWFLENAGSSD